MAFKECRERILAAKPALDDLHERVQGLNAAWSKETSERSVPTECRTKMADFLLAYDQYLTAEDKIFALLQSMDSPQRVRESKSSFDEAANQEDVAVNALHQAGVGNVCDGY
jgi:hypothetical protein